ncbi:hypothetical protein BASA50_000458 [Batrachochytrium salamandrivorans]|uniref:Copper acquisition factor BIM1-like domain-containing protein n=1 Tax=Batrachochytrium salamandrivorans TaxID=1357716 RepID=A0ABQ8EUA7_9FUNG|nr:hypothetical protein BASA50_000458 [Batrachochytrium salamandrivorans]KAJ1345121.1 hypothetical protein BSLG_000636 [Batrachochytrium salamandrivorans]
MLFSCLAAVLVPAVSAHFVLTSPPGRGFDELTEPTGPCGGFNTIGMRSSIGMQSNITLKVADTNASAVINFGPGANPTTFPYTLGHHHYAAIGEYTIMIDLAKAGVPGNSTSTASLGTIQVVVTSADGTLYQCADVSIGAGSTPASPASPASSASSAPGIPSTSSGAPAASGTAAAKAASGAESSLLGFTAIIRQLAAVLPLAVFL